MTKEELLELLVNEADPQKAKAIAEVIAAMEKKEADLEKAKLESTTEAERIRVDERKVDAEIKRTNAEKEASMAKVNADLARTESEERVSKKERVLGWLKIVGTVFCTLFAGFVTIFNARSVMKFEETGTIRTKAWTGVKPDKQQEIR